MTDISYNHFHSMSDNALMALIGGFVKQQRLQQHYSQAEVAEKANVSRSTLSLLERGESVNLGSLIQILRSLDALHVLEAFQIKQSFSPMALAKMQAKERKRAGYKSRKKKA
ncbi:MAG: helix-turn-helix transcriptional regulator [Bacteroidota bacterium]